MPDNLVADSNNAAPVPINPAAAVMGVPPPSNISQAPLASRNAPADPNQPSNPDEQHSALGRGLLHIAHAIEGKQVDYVPQNDGTVQPVVSQRKPGGLFRDMVLGAIAGNVAASTAPTKPGSGGLSGFGIGAQAGINQQAQQQQQRQQQAQQQAKQKQQLNQDNLAAATVASDTASSVNLGHFIGHHDDKEVSALNNSVGIIKDQALSAGGQLAQIPGIDNGKPGNGPSLMQAINRDPSLMQGPVGYHRIPLITYGTDGMAHDGKSWNSGDGNDVNWNDRATVTLVDLPNAAWNKQVTMTKADVNRIAGYPIVKGKDTDSVQTTFGSLFSLGLQSKKDLANAREALYKAPQTPDEAYAIKAEADQIKGDPNAPDDLKRRAAIKGPLADRFLAAQVAQKKALDDAKEEKAPSIDSVPKAQAALDTATIALRKNPKDPDLQQAIKDATSRRDNLVEIENKQKQTQARLDAAARTQAEGKDVESMYKTGKNPITGERLSLDSAPDEFLVDQRTGKPIPTSMLTAVKPTPQEINRHDFAGSVLHSLDQLDGLQRAGKLPNGPLRGLTQEKLSKVGMSTEDAQQALNFISFAQSAATGAHVGGRFSLPVMQKMQGMIGLNMNSNEWKGAEESMRDVMNQYYQNGGRMTVAEFKALPPAEQQRLSGSVPSSSQANAGGGRQNRTQSAQQQGGKADKYAQ